LKSHQNGGRQQATLIKTFADILNRLAQIDKVLRIG